MTIQSLALLCIGVGVIGAAQAAKIPLYDDFSGGTIDPAKWTESETARYVDDNGALKLGRFLYGGTASNSGTTSESYNLNVSSPTPPKALKATITVDEIDVSQRCSANPTPSSSSARLMGTFFNIRPGGPVPGDRTGDVFGIVELQRRSDTTDAPDVVQVYALIVSCTSADCSTSNVIGNVASLGSATVGTKVTAQTVWDAKNNLFRFTRDGKTNVEIGYPNADDVPPSITLNKLDIRNQIANCTNGRIKGGTMAHFDNVGIAP